MANGSGTVVGISIGRLVPVLAVGASVWIVSSVLVSLLIPASTPLAPVLGLVAAVLVVRHRSLMSRLASVGRGAVDELTVAARLADLPRGWRAYHDVPLDYQPVDHVVVGSRGVFAITVEKSPGSIGVAGEQLFRNGRPDGDVVRRLQRQRFKLGKHLGVEVRSVLVFVGTDPGDHEVAGIAITSADRLGTVVTGPTERGLPVDEGRRILALLEAMVKGGGAPGAVGEPAAGSSAPDPTVTAH
jgi:hypothetical protein